MTNTTNYTIENLDHIAAIVATLRQHFSSGITRSVQFRRQQLQGLLRFLRDRESEIIAALHADLRKPEAESLSAEIGPVRAEIKFALKHLSAWTRPKKVGTTLIAQPGKSWIVPEPLGVVLIIAPWNYPLQISLAPLVGALAAGNVVILKPSEIAPAVSNLLAKYLPQYIDARVLSVIEGGIPETTRLLECQFDHIFYTGNGSVGKIVMSAAARHLTPVTLELGGKSPCIVDASANLDIAARRIVWGKFSNAGQTCIAPDYVLVHKSVETALLTKMRKALQEFYGNDAKVSPDYARIINRKHLERLLGLIADSGGIYVGGQSDHLDCYLSPTIMRNPPLDSPVMRDEIFGPILPVIGVDDVNHAISFVNARPKPLALYLFTTSADCERQVISATSSGSVCINYTLLQNVVLTLPFGGVGASGMGAYHGKRSFNVFTHYKSILKKPSWLDASILYPPYSENFKRLIRWFM